MMKIKKLFAAFVVLLALASAALALSDAEYRRFMKDPEFRAADKELSAEWNKIKKQTPPARFEELRRNQREWVSSGRDVEANEYIKIGYSRLEAYSYVTRARAGWLKERAGLAGMIEAADGVQGVYERRRVGEPGTLKVRWLDKAAGTISVEVEAGLVLTPANVRTGEYNGSGPIKRGVFIDPSGVTIRFNGDTVSIETTDAFKMNGDMGMGVVIDGVYAQME